MKYWNIKWLNAACVQVRDYVYDVQGTHEHRVGRVGTGLARNYFPVDNWAITPEQIQVGSGKRPDLTIEKWIEDDKVLIPHCFFEFKSTVLGSFEDIIDQVYDTVVFTLDISGYSSNIFSTFVVAIKGIKISFFIYNNFSSLLDDYGIHNYKGFIPVNYVIPKDKYISYHNEHALADSAWDRYYSKLNFETNSNNLRNIGVESSEYMNHPHIFNLLDHNHREHIHKLFIYIAEQNPNKIFYF